MITDNVLACSCSQFVSICICRSHRLIVDDVLACSCSQGVRICVTGVTESLLTMFWRVRARRE
jgi:hypothetical protein